MASAPPIASAPTVPAITPTASRRVILLIPRLLPLLHSRVEIPFQRAKSLRAHVGTLLAAFRPCGVPTSHAVTGDGVSQGFEGHLLQGRAALKEIRRKLEGAHLFGRVGTEQGKRVVGVLPRIQPLPLDFLRKYYGHAVVRFLNQLVRIGRDDGAGA